MSPRKGWSSVFWDSKRAKPWLLQSGRKFFFWEEILNTVTLITLGNAHTGVL